MTILNAYGKPLVITTKGERGDRGIPGAKGERGDQGIPGAKGERGDQGIPGAKGEKGDQGIPGAKGEKGDQGIPGDKGEKGDIGPPGPKSEILSLPGWELVVAHRGFVAPACFVGSPGNAGNAPAWCKSEPLLNPEPYLRGFNISRVSKFQNPFDVWDCSFLLATDTSITEFIVPKSYTSESAIDHRIKSITFDLPLDPQNGSDYVDATITLDFGKCKRTKDDIGSCEVSVTSISKYTHPSPGYAKFSFSKQLIGLLSRCSTRNNSP